MFDALDTETKSAEDEQNAVDDVNKPSSQLYRWAHFPALLALGIFFVVFRGNSWRWQIAIAGAYTVYVFFFAFGYSLRNADDFFGDPRASRCAVKLLVPYLLVLALLIPGVTLWFHVRPMLPDWITQEGRKGSLWELFGWLILVIAGVWQGSWMGSRIKHQLGEPDASEG